MSDIITTLHPENDADTNLYPNIKKVNIPNKSIDTNKLDDNVLSMIGSLKPSGVDTSTNILGFTTNKGIWIGSDTGNWYYWNGTAYVSGGVYQATSIDENSITYLQIGNDFKQLKEFIRYKVEYIIGAIDGATKRYSSGFTNRAVAKHICYLKASDTIRAYTGFKFRLLSVNADGTINDFLYEGYVTSYTILTDGFYLVQCAKTDDSAISSTDLININKSIIIIYSNNPEIYKSNIISNLTFIVGFVDSSGNVITSQGTMFYSQVVTNNLVRITDNIKISTKTPEFRIKVSYYSYNGTFINDSGWNRSVTINKNSLVRITIGCYQNVNVFGNNYLGDRDYTLEETYQQLVIDKIVEYPSFIIKNNKKYIHLSFDDFDTPFSDITTNALVYTSIFENSFFSYVKKLHDTYGCVISCYCYLTNGDYDIENVTNKFADEFKANSSWLKFGFHTKNPEHNYAEDTAENATTDYNKFITNIIRICGTYEVVDVMPRLHNFAANTASLTAMRDCDCGIKGVLGADDTRQNYNLSTIDGSYLFNHERFFDASTQLHYLTTDIRIERDDTDGIIASINSGAKTWANKCQPLIVFTHTWSMTAENKSELERCLDFAVKNGYEFDFPQNREV